MHFNTTEQAICVIIISLLNMCSSFYVVFYSQVIYTLVLDC